MPDEPTPEQLENARRAGWDPEQGEPPEGWDAHAEPVEPLRRTTSPSEAMSLEERVAIGIA